ncbi:UDP-glucose dehydrogenase family protein [Knoellia aerolata]|uniref:UDP-glucose 6-dehydrogenase n=1 Tax=Knoellia aerolata DSM 18566 TaxID=1385519 RepID=A0A0A0JT82_9MICO|nr:nucleotide sugar dehydrogenase [Knoellia aerolata]KGN40615.1 GDP-mannose 6-dehydrogenase [Knoellia aerolata DSM 18566]
MRVAIFGLGYVGTVTAAGLASRGHDVVGVDVDAGKVAAINAGTSPVVEPGVDLLVTRAVEAGRLRATTDVRQALDRAEVSLVCVGTPSRPRGDTDLSFITRALSDLREAMVEASPPPSGFHSVVIRSTVPPGTGRSVVAPAFAPELLPPGWSVGTAMCPEFLREGCGVEDFFAPPFVVVGTDAARTRESCERLFDFLDLDLHHVDVATAESLKYACNAFHAVKVTFANEMGRIFSQFGVDSRTVMELFCEDHKLNISPSYLRPGFAFGGSCLPKDVRALQSMARASGVDLPLVSSTLTSNELTVRSLVDRVLESGHRRVAILGLSFKMDTDDLRESPNLEIAERFVGKGLDVRIYDPVVNPAKLVGANLRHFQTKLPHVNRLLADSPDLALEDAEVVVVATSDPACLAALRRAHPLLVIDINGRLGADVEHIAGYEGVGW